MNFRNIILCLSIGMLSCGTVGDTFAKGLTQKDANTLIKGMLATKNTELCIEDRYNYDEIKENAFSADKKHTIKIYRDRLNKVSSVSISGKIKKIGKNAFAKLANLSAVDIKSGVKEICDYAFFMCPKLDKITIPNSVQSIGRQAFGGCSLLKDVIFYEGLESIGHTAFLQCTNLEKLTIPCSVNEIDRNAFEGCTSLSSVIFDCKPGYDGVKKLIGTFSKCNNLDTITLPNNVEEICSYTFFQCAKLKSIEFPKSLKKVLALMHLKSVMV